MYATLPLRLPEGPRQQTLRVDVNGNSPSFTLSGFGYKVKGVQHANLSWSGTDLAGNVVIQRNGVPVVTTLDDGAHVDNIGKKGGGSYQYKICESGTSNCSNIITIIF